VGLVQLAQLLRVVDHEVLVLAPSFAGDRELIVQMAQGMQSTLSLGSQVAEGGRVGTFGYWVEMAETQRHIGWLEGKALPLEGYLWVEGAPVWEVEDQMASEYHHQSPQSRNQSWRFLP
jgi:hypothetical protein